MANELPILLLKKELLASLSVCDDHMVAAHDLLVVDAKDFLITTGLSENESNHTKCFAKPCAEHPRHIMFRYR